jgi:hypothetical protein
MLKEYTNVQQINGEPKRRWFENDYFDLIVWYADDDEIFGFQLCYDKDTIEKALTWKKSTGYTHRRIDTGEYSAMQYPASPTLEKDGLFRKRKIADRFLKESAEIDPRIRMFVLKKIKSKWLWK